LANGNILMALIDFIAKLIGNDLSNPFELKNGRGLVWDDFEALQAQFTIGVESQLYGKKPFLLRGGEITSAGSGLYNIAEALVFIGDNIALVPPQNNIALTDNTFLHYNTDAGDPWTDAFPRSFASGTSPRAGIRRYKFKISETLPSAPYDIGVPITQAGWLRTISDIRREEATPIGAIQPIDASTSDFDATTGKGIGNYRGWVLCNGQTTTFAGVSVTLPNLKGRVPVHLDDSQTEFDTLNKSGGLKTHQLTVNELPAHKHYLASAGNHTDFLAIDNQMVTMNDFAGDTAYTLKGNINPANLGNSSIVGANEPHNNLQPYHTLLFAKYLGLE